MSEQKDKVKPSSVPKKTLRKKYTIWFKPLSDMEELHTLRKPSPVCTEVAQTAWFFPDSIYKQTLVQLVDFFEVEIQ